MPIKIPKDLPATKTLQSEHIFVMDSLRAAAQDIRPLRILILNLMPTKIETETQLARLLGNSPLQVELELLAVSGRIPKHTPQEHMLSFYKSFSEVRENYYDGLIITGAPVEQMPFEDVDYWQELCQIMQWSKTNVFSTFHICWGAQAGLYYHYGIEKLPVPEKIFGIFPHRVLDRQSMLFRGFDDVFWAPHSRHTTVNAQQLRSVPELHVLSESDEAGVYAVSAHEGRQIFIFGHSEYDVDTLEKEYRRDKQAGLSIHVPKNYYPNDDDTQAPVCKWRSGANLLYANWLNYYVYQATPYSISTISHLHGKPEQDEQ